MKSKSMLILGALVATAGAALLYKSSQSGSVVAGVVGLQIRRDAKDLLSSLALWHKQEHLAHAQTMTAGLINQGIRPRFLTSEMSFHDAHADAGTYYDHGIDPANLNVTKIFLTPETYQDRIYQDGQKFVEGQRVVAFSHS